MKEKELNITQYAKLKGISRKTVHDRINNGKIPKEDIILIPKTIEQIKIIVREED